MTFSCCVESIVGPLTVVSDESVVTAIRFGRMLDNGNDGRRPAVMLLADRYHFCIICDMGVVFNRALRRVRSRFDPQLSGHRSCRRPSCCLSGRGDGES